MDAMATIKDKAAHLADSYDRNPLLKALAQVASGCSFGVAGAIETAVLTTFENARQERQKAFFDELNEKNVELTEEKIQSEDFLYFWLATTKAVNFTREREKIKLFASLFVNFSQGENYKNPGIYEEWLNILEDISYREFHLLLHLRYNAPDSALEWPKFDQMIEEKLGIKANEVKGWLGRLVRTGLCRYSNTFDDIGEIEITPNFESFVQELNLNGLDIDFKVPENANR